MRPSIEFGRYIVAVIRMLLEIVLQMLQYYYFNIVLEMYRDKDRKFELHYNFLIAVKCYTM